MSKVVSKSIGAFCQHYPKVACVVTASAKGRDNAMAVAWHSVLSVSPPLYGVALSPKRFTYQLITESKEFGINFLPFESAEILASVGGSDGREVDKFSRFDIARDESVETGVPILTDAYAAYECKLVDDRGYGDHRWIVGEIVAVHWLKEALTQDEVIDLDKVQPTLYIGKELYLAPSKDTMKYLDRQVYAKGLKEG